MNEFSVDMNEYLPLREVVFKTEENRQKRRHKG